MSCWPFSGDRHRPSPRLPPSPYIEHRSGTHEKDGALVTTTTRQAADRFAARVAEADWAAVTAEVDDYGCALSPQLLTPAECGGDRCAVGQAARTFPVHRDLRPAPFRRQRRLPLLRRPFPGPVQALRQTLYPRLLPIARDWSARLGRDAEWPGTLDEWLAVCHAAGQRKPTPILLRYEPGGWNALHRDLYGDLVFPLQVVINLSAPGDGSHRRRVPAGRAAAAGPVPAARRRSSRRATAWCSPPATAQSARRAAGRHRRCDTVSPQSALAGVHPWPGVPRRQLNHLHPGPRGRRRPGWSSLGLQVAVVVLPDLRLATDLLSGCAVRMPARWMSRNRCQAAGSTSPDSVLPQPSIFTRRVRRATKPQRGRPRRLAALRQPAQRPLHGRADGAARQRGHLPPAAPL